MNSFSCTKRLLVALVAVLAPACAPLEQGDFGVTGEEALAFVESFEAAIRGGDWEIVRSSFVPSASVLYREVGADAESRQLNAAWLLDTLISSHDALGYRRSREIEGVEPRHDGAMVRSLIRERALGRGVVVHSVAHEWMHVTRYRNSIRITVLGLEVRPDTERIDP